MKKSPSAKVQTLYDDWQQKKKIEEEAFSAYRLAEAEEEGEFELADEVEEIFKQCTEGESAQQALCEYTEKFLRTSFILSSWYRYEIVRYKDRLYVESRRPRYTCENHKLIARILQRLLNNEAKARLNEYGRLEVSSKERIAGFNAIYPKDKEGSDFNKEFLREMSKHTFRLHRQDYRRLPEIEVEQKESDK